MSRMWANCDCGDCLLGKLRPARAEHDLQRTLVQDEMDGHSARGELWQNDRCKAWPDYVRALAALNALRNEFGV